MSTSVVFPVRARILLWLLLVLLPVAGASMAAVWLIDVDLSERAHADLANLRRLESARIEEELDDYEREGASLAADEHVREFTSRAVRARTGELAPDTIVGGRDGFRVVHASTERPLDELALRIRTKSLTAGSSAQEVRIVAPDGEVLGVTPGFSWEPTDPSVADRVVETATPGFGDAFADDGGRPRVALVTPISSPDGRIVGTMQTEMDLGPVVDFVGQHETFGRTSEVHLAQRLPDGSAQFITPLRFDSTAAFRRLVPADADVPLQWAFDSPLGTTVEAEDYRGVESVLSLQTTSNGWALVAKIDRAEAMASINDARWVIAIAGAAASVGVIIGWAILLRPLNSRLRRLAQGAKRVARGVHEPLDDRGRDELGALARTIDQLAMDLAEDSRLREEFEEELRRQASTDELTGLFNRQQATNLVDELVRTASRHPSSLLFLDLDGFKGVNDTYGHLVGDEVLIGVARRLRDVVAGVGSVARWGGDEFVVILPGVDADHLEGFASIVRSVFDAPVQTSVGPQTIRCSLGSAVSSPERSLDELLSEADHRMFAEKQARKGERAVQSAALRSVERALDERRLEPFYQPVVSISDRGSVELRGAEALARIRSTSGAVVPPAEFLPSAQDNHLGAAIDDRIISMALDDLRRWRLDGVVGDEFVLAVNLCEASTRDQALADRLGAMLAERHLPPTSIALEISEETRDVTPSVIESLSRLGVQLAVDDLGTGRSSHARLLDTRARLAKIDRRWIAGVGDPDTHTSVVLSSLVDLCRSLDMTVVIEGIETPEQLAAAAALGIQQMQGYLFDRPMPASDFELAWGRSSGSSRRSALVGFAPRRLVVPS